MNRFCLQRMMALAAGMLLTVCLAMSAGCASPDGTESNEGNETVPSLSESSQEAETQPWEDASLPLRSRVVAYMTAMSEVEWTASEKIDLTKSKKALVYHPGILYKGLPYTNDWDSSLEEFRSNLKDGTYVGPVTDEECTGVDCSSSVLAAWSIVSPSVNCVWTLKMLPQYGFGTVKVGEYVIPEGAEGTAPIIEANDKETIFRAYAELQPGDAVVQYTDHGHSRMIVSEPDIRYKDDGTISGLSSICTTEIDSRLYTGSGFFTCWIVNHKYYFQDLLNAFYVPLTIPELVSGEAPEAELSVSAENTPESLLTEGGLRGTLESGYRIFEVRCSVYADGGNTAPVREAVDHPVNNIGLVMRSRSADLAKLNKALDIPSLPPGSYLLKLTAKTAGEMHEVLLIRFEK